MPVTTETTAAMPSNPVLVNVPWRLWRKMSNAAAVQRTTIARVSKGHRAYARTEVTNSSTLILDESTQRKCREPHEFLVRELEAGKSGAGSGLRANSASSCALLPQPAVETACLGPCSPVRRVLADSGRRSVFGHGPLVDRERQLQVLPHSRRGQGPVLFGDSLVYKAVLFLGDTLDLGQDILRYDVAFRQRLQGHVDRTSKQAQHPVLGRFRDRLVERDVRDYGDALLELVHLYGPCDHEPVVLRTPDGGQLRSRHVRNPSGFPQLLERKLVHV